MASPWYVFPFVPATGISQFKWPWERTDQGVDFGGAGALRAIGAGKIVYVGRGGSTGWPGLGTYILLKLAHPFQGHRYIYYAEDINPSVHAGQTVKAGQIIGRATGGSTGIELGFGSATPNLTYAASTTGYTEGQQTVAGKQFRSFISGLSGKTTPGSSHTSGKTTSSVHTTGGNPLSPITWLPWKAFSPATWFPNIANSLGIPTGKQMLIRLGLIILGGLLILVGLWALAGKQATEIAVTAAK